MDDNEFETLREKKFEPRIKLNHNIVNGKSTVITE